MAKTVCDKFDFNRNIFLFLWLGTISLVLILGARGLFFQRSLPSAPLSLVKRLDLTSLSLVGSGQILREPAILHPGVDLRMVPGIPPVDLSSAGLFLSVEPE